MDDSRLRPTEEVGAAATLDDATARRDHLLVERALEGDLGAFNQLVEAYQDLCHALVARMVPDPDQAGDAVQEAFFSAYRNLRSYRGPSFRGWLTRIAINAAMDLQRARKRRPVSPYPELEDDSWQPPAGRESDPESIATTGERQRALVAAMGAIAADQRTAIVLYDVEGYDYGEIAGMTGVSLGTVKSRIHRGRLALRGCLPTGWNSSATEGVTEPWSTFAAHSPAAAADEHAALIVALDAGDLVEPIATGRRRSP